MQEESHMDYKQSIQELKASYKDPKWLKKREKILTRDGQKCRICSSEHPLEVHHSYYNNKPAWDYPDESLITLCRSCHEHVHKIRETIRDYSGKYSFDILQDLYWVDTYWGQKSEIGYNSLKWAIKVIKIIDRDKSKCQICDSSLSLEVHHIYYAVDNDKPAWDYPDECLITLCSSCHKSADHLKALLTILKVNIIMDFYKICTTKRLMSLQKIFR
jgi:5-methylcytosine-specific restriction endonuclease McrA